jgi:hypothetical protein
MGLFSTVKTWLLGDETTDDRAQTVDTTATKYTDAVAVRRDMGPVLLRRMDALGHMKRHDPAKAQLWFNADQLLRDEIAYIRRATAILQKHGLGK